MWSKTQYYRRKRRAEQLGCSIDDLPDERGKHGNHIRGSAHPKWNGGRIISEDGYVKIRVGLRHPLADLCGYAYEHLVVWVSAGNPLPAANETLHHISHDKQDNRIENLGLMNRAQHNAHHIAGRGRDDQGRFMPAGRLLDGRTWDEMPT